MLTGLRLRDYKAYSGEVRVPLRRLTVLLGKNNSGKTAAARLPLLLFDALAQADPRRKDPLPRMVRSLGYGSGMTELVHGESAHASFGLGLTLETEDLGVPLDVLVDIQLRQALKTGLTAFVSRFSASPLVSPIEWTGDLRAADISYGDKAVRRFDGVIPRFEDEVSDQQAQVLRRIGAQRLGDLVHLVSLRRPLQPLYERTSSEGTWDPEGGDVPHLLNESDELLDSVTQWYREALSTEVGLVQEASSFRLISPGRAGAEHSLARAGQGIQQVLPVVTHLRSMALGRGPLLLVVEEPELNLHPAAHGALADLAVDAVTIDQQSQVLVETHSENFVLRLRRHVASGMLDSSAVNLLWFDHQDGHTTLDEITINDDGTVSDWPTGVFSEDLAEARAIIRERAS